jgi:hypothetical protein
MSGSSKVAFGAYISKSLAVAVDPYLKRKINKWKN